MMLLYISTWTHIRCVWDLVFFFFFSSRRRHTRWTGDWSSDVCSSDLPGPRCPQRRRPRRAIRRRRPPARPSPRRRSEERRVGKSVDLGGRRIIKKKKKEENTRVQNRTMDVL